MSIISFDNNFKLLENKINVLGSCFKALDDSRFTALTTRGSEKLRMQTAEKAEELEDQIYTIILAFASFSKLEKPDKVKIEYLSKISTFLKEKESELDKNFTDLVKNAAFRNINPFNNSEKDAVTESLKFLSNLCKLIDRKMKALEKEPSRLEFLMQLQESSSIDVEQLKDEISMIYNPEMGNAHVVIDIKD